MQGLIKSGMPAFIFLQCFCMVVAAQTGFIDSVKQKFTNPGPMLVQEKMYVHTDKSVYIAGDIIWFKIYNVDAALHRPIDVSKVAYVEIISADQKALLQAKIAMDEGVGQGSMVIPASVQTGNYRLRAYTSWMKNFSPEFYFEKTLSLINPSRNVSAAVLDSFHATIQFFPEGGNLVYGSASRIGFAAKDRYGKGVAVKGWILDDRMDTVTGFQSLKFGLGHFLLQPISGRKYTAHCVLPGGKLMVQPLPPGYDKGYVMKLDNTGNDQLQLVVADPGLTGEQFVYVFVQSRQQVQFATRGNLINGQAVFSIDKKMLNEGISQFTVFNQERQPVCERLFFKRPLKEMKMVVKTDKLTYLQREKVNLDLAVQGHDASAVSTDLSAAVFLQDSLQESDEVDIGAWLYLVSDLRGRVDSPSYYLNNDDAEAADNLMLSHGWRRFNWEEILKDKDAYFEYVPEYSGHIVVAKVTDRRTGIPAAGIPAYLSVPAERFSFGNAVSDASGRLRFDTRNFYGANEIVAQTNYWTDSSHRIDVLSPFSERYSGHPLSLLQLPVARKQALLDRITAAQVQNAFSADSQQRFIAPDIFDSTVFYGAADRKFFLDDYTRFSTMEEVLREYVNDVQVRKSKEGFHLRVLNGPYKVFFDGAPMILLDGVPIFDANKIVAFDPLKIKKLEVLSRKYYQGALTYNGIISYSTYQGDLAGFQLDPGALIVRYDGLQIRREFYSPTYETSAQRTSRLPDFRSTLYWSAKAGEISGLHHSISFFTSDVPGKYMVVVQGITSTGLPVSATLSFTVEK